MHLKDNKGIIILISLIFIIVIIVTIMFLWYKTLMKSTNFNHNSFNFEIEKNSKRDLINTQIYIDHHYDINNKINIFKIIDRKDDKVLLRATYDGLSELMSYRIFDNEIVLWINGIDTYLYKEEQIYNPLPKMFIYNSIKCVLKEIPIKEENVIILDVVKNKNDYYPIFEKALNVKYNGYWDNSSLYIKNKIYNINKVGYI